MFGRPAPAQCRASRPDRSSRRPVAARYASDSAPTRPGRDHRGDGRSTHRPGDPGPPPPPRLAPVRSGRRGPIVATGHLGDRAWPPRELLPACAPPSLQHSRDPRRYRRSMAGRGTRSVGRRRPFAGPWRDRCGARKTRLENDGRGYLRDLRRARLHRSSCLPLHNRVLARGRGQDRADLRRRDAPAPRPKSPPRGPNCEGALRLAGNEHVSATRHPRHQHKPRSIPAPCPGSRLGPAR